MQLIGNGKKNKKKTLIECIADVDVKKSIELNSDFDFTDR